MRRTARPRIAGLSLFACLALAAAIPGSAFALPPVSALEQSTESLLTSQLTAYSSVDGRYAAGVWKSTDATCWACANGGAATAAATAYVVGGESDPQWLDMAEATINTAIAHRQAADGAFTGSAGNTQSPPIATYFFGVEFGTVYHLLAPYLSARTRLRWQRSLEAAADYLEASGNASFYINGNINLGFAEFFYMVWSATGNPTYLTDYDTEWDFVTAPPQNRFPGAGLVITRAPAAADGADGSGYLAEVGPTATGFDPEYTGLQLDEASRLYLLSGDPRALRLANLEINQLAPLLSRANGQVLLNDDNGTRYEYQYHPTGFLDAAYTVLGLFGDRPALQADVVPELDSEKLEYSWGQDNPTYRRALGNDVSVQALAEWMYATGQKVTDALRLSAAAAPEVRQATAIHLGRAALLRGLAQARHLR